jgi:molybdopterin-biosynthesis enzyme MoeA-like protein
MQYRHDDITYQSIAKAFDLPLVLHEEAYERMKKLSRPSKTQPDFSWDVESPQKTARLRMVELPIDKSRDLAKQALFPRDELWVPVSVVNGNVHILPGIPRLCKLVEVPHLTLLSETSTNTYLQSRDSWKELSH